MSSPSVPSTPLTKSSAAVMSLSVAPCSLASIRKLRISTLFWPKRRVHSARRVAWAGFAVAVLVSLALAPWRIALASGTAFIVAQWLDISAFNRLRQMSWWQAPLIGSAIASVIDTALFFFIAFYGSDMDWLTLAAGDLGVKLAMAALLLAPYRALLPHLGVWRPA